MAVSRKRVNGSHAISTQSAGPALIERLAELAQNVGTAPDITGIFRGLREFCELTVPYCGVFVSLLEPESGMRRCVYAGGVGYDEDVTALPLLPMSESPNARAITTGEVIITDDFQQATAGIQRIDIGTDKDPRIPMSSLAVPLTVLGTAIGAFEVQALEPAAYRAEHVVAMQMAASLAAIAVRNMQLLDKERSLRAAAQRSEAALRESQERFRRLVQMSPDAIAVQVDGRFRFLNKAAVELVGAESEDQLLGRPVMDVVHPEYHPVLRERMRTVLEDHTAVPVMEMQAIRLDGTVIRIEAAATPCVYEGKRGAQIVARDVTHRKQAEDVLRESEGRFRSLVELAGDAIYTLAPDGTLTSLNPAFETITGWSPQDWLGKNFVPLVHPDDLPIAMDRYNRLLQGERPPIFELRIRTRSGKHLVAEFTTAPRIEDGVVIGMTGIARDVTDRKASEEQLRKSEERLRLATETGDLGIWEWDIQHDRIIWTQNLAAMHGLEPGVFGGTLMDFLALVEPDDRMSVMNTGGTVVTPENPEYPLHYRVRLADGTVRWIQGAGRFYFDENGKPLRALGVAMDVTERREAEEALRESEELFRRLVRSMDDLVLTIDQDMRCTGVFGRWIQKWGFDETMFLGKTPEEIIGKEEARVHEEAMQRALGGEDLVYDWSISVREAMRHFETSLSPLRSADGSVVGAVAVSRDVTDRRHSEEETRRLAYFDSLSGLPNRLLFRDRLQVAVAQARRSKHPLAVMFLDLDRFKDINDTLGHSVGDRLLAKVGQELVGLVREGDTVARVGGDEFTVLLPNLQDESEALEVASRLLQHLESRPVDDYAYHLTGSIGIAFYPGGGNSPETLLRHADTAMYRAKERGGNTFEVYRRSMSARLLERVRLENDLRRAIQEEELALHYQPQVSLATGESTCVEALIRWQHPDGRLIPPDRFIPLAEDTGLILPITEWVLRTTLAQQKAWRDQGLPVIKASVNVSARDFQRPDLAHSITTIAAELGVGLQDLSLEITEGVVVQDLDYAIKTLTKLRKLGVEVAIDDFGTGYSSLSYLRRLPVDAIKVDRSFIADLLKDEKANALVSNIISLAHGMGLKVIAEGVETAGQLEFLRAEGCDEYQGYYFSRAVPADKLPAVFGRRSGAHAG